MAGKNPAVNWRSVKHYVFSTTPCLFLSQIRDGTARIQFRDGVSLDIIVATGALVGNKIVKATLRPYGETDATGSASAEWDAYRQKAEDHAQEGMSPSTMAEYLRAATQFAQRKANGFLTGGWWANRNESFYSALVHDVPDLTQKLEERVIV